MLAIVCDITYLIHTYYYIFTFVLLLPSTYVYSILSCLIISYHIAYNKKSIKIFVCVWIYLEEWNWEDKHGVLFAYFYTLTTFTRLETLFFTLASQFKIENPEEVARKMKPMVHSGPRGTSNLLHATIQKNIFKTRTSIISC